ncbi:MAG: beta-ketoacyl synthase chain length factor [Limisphaerales bacterium]
MSGIFISGMGAVSPAGWGVECLRDGDLPEPQAIARPGWKHPLSVRRVPAMNPRPPWAVHPRMRRSALISQFAMGAAMEALSQPADGPLGIVFCTTCGCVNYSRRFYDEVLHDPAVASPLLFPETVFNAPASHLSAVLASGAANYTLVGDSGIFLHGLALAAGWLADGRVTRCLVVAAEEVDWIIADALHHFRKSAILTEGAGALLLTRERQPDTCAELEYVTDPQPFAARGGKAVREAAARRVAAALPARTEATFRRSEFDEAFSAGTAWQVLAALRRAQEQQLSHTTVIAPGAYQEAIGASFVLSRPIST